MNIQIKKKITGRKRFIKTLPLVNPEDWLTELSALKHNLSQESSFQIVGSKVYFEVDLDMENPPRMMLEVIGVPVDLSSKALELEDFDSSEVYIYKIIDRDIFNTSYLELKLLAKTVIQGLLGNLNKQGIELLPLFQIVFAYEKIELHLFRQKDYIQNQH